MRNKGTVPDSISQMTEETREILRAVLPPPSRAALLDFPAHVNAGDSLIHLGQRSFLRNLGYEIGYLADLRVYSADQLRKRVPTGPILLQGGGSLGSRYGHIQDFREQIILDFPDRTIVQLPQSMEFSDERRQRQAAELFAAHPNLLLLIRDFPSLARARAAFPGTRIEFCPDLAIGYGPHGRTGPADHDVLLLVREDTESVLPRPFRLPSRVTSLQTDWGFSGASRVRWNLGMAPSAAARHIPALRPALQPWVESSFEGLAALNVRNAMNILSRGRVVVTDRLHAAVLAALMGIPATVLDTANGKISAAYEAYLHRLPTLDFATSIEEAEKNVIRQLSSGP